jgi:hypothetical protein
MPRFDHVLSFATIGVSLIGGLFAQMAQSPETTLGAIALAMLGLLTLWVRSHYALARDRLEVDRVKAELKVYRQLCASLNLFPGDECPSESPPSSPPVLPFPGHKARGNRRRSTPAAPGVAPIDGPA